MDKPTYNNLELQITLLKAQLELEKERSKFWQDEALKEANRHLETLTGITHLKKAS